MRIGIFTDTYPPFINGVSTSIQMLENALKKMGHQVFIVTVNTENMRYKYEEGKNIIRIPGVPTGFYDYRLTGAYPLKAINKIRKWNLDIIHSHTEFGVGSFARIFAKQFDIPLVHTFHTMYEDYIHYITKGYFIKTSKKIVQYLTDFYCDQTVTELIVPAKKAHDLFKDKYHYKRDVHIVPTGFEIERFFPENQKKSEVDSLRKILNIKKNDFIILTVGRVAKEKSMDFLIENHVSLVKKYDAKLMIVGDGPDLEKFKTLAKKLGIAKNVIFTGKVPWEDITKYYQLAKVFTTASTSETQGLTIIEAISSALPVVAINDESFNKVIEPNKNGYLFTDNKEYLEYIGKLIENEELRLALAKQAKLDASKYTSKIFAQKMLEVYKKAINSNKEKGDRFTLFNAFRKFWRGLFGGKKGNS